MKRVHKDSQNLDRLISVRVSGPQHNAIAVAARVRGVTIAEYCWIVATASALEESRA